MTQPKNKRLITEASADGVNAGYLSDPLSSSRTVLNAAIAGQIDPLQRAAPLLPGSLVANNCHGYGMGEAPNSTAQTARIAHDIGTDCTDLRVAYCNWSNNISNVLDADGTATLTVRASIEVAGTIYRLTFNGQAAGTVDGGGLLVSDPLPLSVSKGDVIYTRTYVSGTTWFANFVALNIRGRCGAAAGDLTAPGSAAIPASSAQLYGPAAITGTPTAGASQSPQLCLVGDSLSAGTDDGGAPSPTSGGALSGWQTDTFDRTGGGYLARAMHGQAGYVLIGRASDLAKTFLANSGHFRRATFLASAKAVVCEYGRNDISNAVFTLTQIQQNLIGVWLMASRRGCRVYQTTITPFTTSTDGWFTAANQTPSASPNPDANEAVRVQLNDWLRAGAPIIGVQPKPVGTAGAILAGDPGHPLSTYGDAYVIDVADLAESARNSGKWNVGATRTVTDAAITAGSNVVTSATAVFVAGDVGAEIYVAGAGVAGADLHGFIQGRTDASTVSISLNASTTVAAAAAGLGISYTSDGLHPNPHGAKIIAGGIDVSLLV